MLCYAERYSVAQNKGCRNGRTSRGDAGARSDQRACRPVLLLSAGAARRRRDQGRSARLRRPRAPARRRSRAQSPRHGGVVPGAKRGEALAHAELEITQGPRGLLSAGRHRRRRGRKFSSRRDGAAGARLRRAQSGQERHCVLRDLRLRPGRTAAVQPRLRSDHPRAVRGDERHRRRAIGAVAGRLSESPIRWAA